MKIRQGFVSNSSSSSFVVAFPNGCHDTQISFTVTTDIKDFAENTFNSVTALEEYLQDDYGDKKWWPDWYQDAVTAIKNGHYVMVGSFSDEGYEDRAEAILCNDGLDPDMNDYMTVIESEGGY